MVITFYAGGYMFELQSGDRIYCVKSFVIFLILFRKMFVIVLAHECFHTFYSFFDTYMS
jgi:hypothetical protein